VAVEIERGESAHAARRRSSRRCATRPPLAPWRALAEPLLEPAKVRLVRVRLGRLAPLTAQRSLLPLGPDTFRSTGR
jgi:hypothetical protein